MNLSVPINCLADGYGGHLGHGFQGVQGFQTGANVCDTFIGWLSAAELIQQKLWPCASTSSTTSSTSSARDAVDVAASRTRFSYFWLSLVRAVRSASLSRLRRPFGLPWGGQAFAWPFRLRLPLRRGGYLEDGASDRDGGQEGDRDGDGGRDGGRDSNLLMSVELKPLISSQLISSQLTQPLRPYESISPTIAPQSRCFICLDQTGNIYSCCDTCTAATHKQCWHKFRRAQRVGWLRARLLAFRPPDALRCAVCRAGNAASLSLRSVACHEESMTLKLQEKLLDLLRAVINDNSEIRNRVGSTEDWDSRNSFSVEICSTGNLAKNILFLVCVWVCVGIYGVLQQPPYIGDVILPALGLVYVGLTLELYWFTVSYRRSNLGLAAAIDTGGGAEDTLTAIQLPDNICVIVSASTCGPISSLQRSNDEHAGLRNRNAGFVKNGPNGSNGQNPGSMLHGYCSPEYSPEV